MRFAFPSIALVLLASVVGAAAPPQAPAVKAAPPQAPQLCPCGDDCKCKPGKCPAQCPAVEPELFPVGVTQAQFQQNCPGGVCKIPGMSSVSLANQAPPVAAPAPTSAPVAATTHQHPVLYAVTHPLKAFAEHHQKKMAERAARGGFFGRGCK